MNAGHVITPIGSNHLGGYNPLGPPPVAANSPASFPQDQNGGNGVNGALGANGTNGANGVNGTDRVNGTNRVNGFSIIDPDAPTDSIS